MSVNAASEVKTIENHCTFNLISVGIVAGASFANLNLDADGGNSGSW